MSREPSAAERKRLLLIAFAREEKVPPETIQYLNRLSDAMFVWSRWVNHAVGAPEILWQPNEAASARESPGSRQGL